MNDKEQKGLTPYMSQMMAICFAIGSAIGWGSLVVTSSSYLGRAGIAGSIIGMLVGMVVMLAVARNYSYLMQIYPESGGAYAFSREIFGYDYGFLTAWFLVLTYLSILWANATSLPLFARFFIGPVFQFGKLYTIFGYDVFVGEILLTMAGILLISLLCMRSKKAAAYVMTALVGILTIAIVISAVGGLIGYKGSFDYAFVPESSAITQIIYIAVISPWAFIGFENVSHSAEEFSFSKTKMFRILVIAVVVTTALYILVTLLSMTAYPERYGSWLEYIRDRGNLDGLEALPAFYAANHYLGSFGVGILMAALLSLVITSLIGQTTAASRLFFALGRDKILPERFAEINRYGIPGKAIMLVAASALIIPFFGRTAIGWIVDVTCIGATLIYGIVSACARKRAVERNDKTERITGTVGLAVMIFYGLYTLLPNLFSTGSIERETYFLFIVWTILGFIFFRGLLARDKEHKFGNSVIVWVSLLSLVLFISLVWMRQAMIQSNSKMEANITQYYEQQEGDREEELVFLQNQIREMEKEDTRTIAMAMVMFAFSLLIMFSNHSYMTRRQEESEALANIDPLTGVKSKHAYLTTSREINSQISKGEIDEFAVVVCDVNGLKHVNDTLGHKAGDEYICAAAQLICEIFQHSPVFRLGGDEFTLVLRGHDYDMRDDLMKMLHDCSVDNIGLNKVVVSGGMSLFDKASDQTFHQVFERADGLMYEEKMLLKSKGAITREGSEEAVKEVTAKTTSIPETEIERREYLRKRVNMNLDLLDEESGVDAGIREELTGLYKKEYFWQGVDMYDELFPDLIMDCIMIDIRHFHMINERFGRQFGDDVLRHTALCIKEYATEAGGIACRRGTDLFEIYCPHKNDYSDIIELVRGDSEIGAVVAPKLLIGVYGNADKTLRVGQRYDRAKMAIDNIKRANINNIGYYDEGMYEVALSKEELMEDFQKALKNRDFEVYLQPKYDIRGDKPVLCGAEALARWNHPKRGMMLPKDFVPMLEQNGRIFDLDKYIWAETAKIVRELKDQMGFAMPVSVNVSRLDLLAPDIRDVFLGILKKYDLSTEDIILEITESAYTDNTQTVFNVARELNANDPGFRIEIDDFGSGYSSLDMLSTLPADAVKLDVPVLLDCFGADKGRHIMKMIIDMAKGLDLSVVAEGVETEEQFNELKELGCDFVQGFYFAKPLRPEEFRAML